MSTLKTFLGFACMALLCSSCFNNSRPNYQYMPNMYEAVSYETFEATDAFRNGQEAQLPPEHTVKRGGAAYPYENSPEGKEKAIAELTNMLTDSISRAGHLAKGKELYDIYCGVCHGNNGDGQGILAKREKILGVPSYSDPGRNINDGSTYHAIYYGINSMGSYAAQLNETERWQVVMHVQKLKEDLAK